MNNKSNTGRLIILITFILLINSHLFAKEYQISFYDAFSGLANHQITSVIKDQDGFIWIGTQNGLFRYDGLNYKSYRTENNNPYSISDNFINNLFIDSQNRMWVSTKVGLNIYNSYSEYFTRVKIDNEVSDALPNSLIQLVYEDNSGDIWIGHFDGFSKLITPNDFPENFRFENYSFNESGGDKNWVRSICQESEKYIWFGMLKGGVYRYNKEKGTIKSYNNDAIGEMDVIRTFVSPQGKLMFLDLRARGLFEYDRINDNIVRSELDKYLDEFSIFRDVLIDSQKNLWILAQKGIVKIDLNGNVDYDLIENDTRIKHSTLFSCIYEDNRGVVWIGTEDEGLITMSPPLLQHYIYKGEFLSLQSSNKILDLLYTKNGLFYMARDNTIKYLFQDEIIETGLYTRSRIVYNGKNKIYSNLKYYDIIKKETGSSGFSISRLGYYLIDSKGIFHLFLENSRRYIYDVVTKYKSTPTKIILNDKPDKFIQLMQVDFFNDTSYVMLDRENVYISSIDSFNMKVLVNVDDINCNEIFSFFYCENDTIYIVANHRIFIYQQDKGIIKELNTNKVMGDIVFSLITDKNNNIWYTTNKGVVRYDIKNDCQSIINKSDGLPFVSFSSTATRSEDDFIYFASGNNIIKIDAKSYKFQMYIPPLVFTNFYLFNKEVEINAPNKSPDDYFLKASVNHVQRIELKHKQNYFTIEYACLDFKHKSKNQFRYYLEGLDKSWGETTQNNKVTYNGLPPGKYTFKVKAANNSGIWNENAKELEIIIIPPFWKTFWFKIIIIVFVFAVIFVFFYMRLKSMENKKIVLEKQVRSRTVELYTQKEEILIQADNLKEINVLLNENKEEIQAQAEELFNANTNLQKVNDTKDKFFSIIAHDLKNPFQAIIGFSDLMIKDIHNINLDRLEEFASNINDSSKTAFGLLENLLIWARSQTNKIKYQPKLFKISEPINNTIKLLSINAKNKGIKLVNNVSEDLIIFADDNMITTVFRNLINNAIKFTPSGGTVSVDGNKRGELVEIRVSDTGVGMKSSTINKLFNLDRVSTSGTSGESGTGLGLIIVKEFLDINDANIEVNSESGKGSTFTISFKSNVRKDIEEEAKIEIKNEESSEEVFREDELELIDKKEKIILIAEDNQNIRNGINSYFKDEFKVIEAADGIEGWKYAKSLIPDLIITDWMMPNMDGLEFCEKIKNNRFTSHIPVIVLTAKSADAAKVEGFKSGADEYITKPFSYELLKVRVNNLIRSRLELRKLFSPEKDKEYEINKLSHHDQEMMNDIVSIIDKQIDNSDYSITQLCEEIGMSSSQLNRKLIAITGLPPILFIRNHRLKVAAKMLKEKKESVSEIMYAVGFSNSSYFAKSFKQVYGCSPSKYE